MQTTTSCPLKSQFLNHLLSDPHTNGHQMEEAWKHLVAAIKSGGSPGDPSLLSSIKYITAFPLLLNRLIQAYKVFLFRSLEAHIQQCFPKRVKLRTGLDQIVSEFYHRKKECESWLLALNASAIHTRELNLLLSAQLHLFMTPEVAALMSQKVLGSDLALPTFPISLDQANQVRRAVNLPLLVSLRSGSKPNTPPFVAQLRVLGAFEAMAVQLLAAARDQVDAWVDRNCTESDLVDSVTDLGLAFVDHSVFPRLAYALGTFPLTDLYQALLQHLSHCIVMSHARRFLDILHRGPSLCRGAITDLKLCLNAAQDSDELAEHAQSQIVTHMLLPSIPTSAILTWFITAIHVFRAIDAGVTFHRVIEIMRSYLRSRDVVSDLVLLVFPTDGATVSHPELLEGGELVMDKDEQKYIVHVATDGAVVPSLQTTKRVVPEDTLSILMNIYDSKSHFVDAFQRHLHSWMLTHWATSDLVPLTAIIEKLAVRFGVSHFLKCLAMVRDVERSCRVLCDQESHVIRPLIISREVWPLQDEEPIQMPAEIQMAINKYTHSYQHTHPHQTLEFQHTQGTMHIDIELEDGSVHTYECSTPSGIFMMHVAELGSAHWSVEQVAKGLGVSVTSLYGPLQTWLASGVVVGVAGQRGVFMVVEQLGEAAGVVTLKDQDATCPGHAMPERTETAVGECEEDALAGVSKAQVSNWTMFTRLAVVNRDGGTLDQVYTKVTRIIMGQKKPSMDQIKCVLDQLVGDGHVECTSDGEYVKKQ